MTYKHIPKKKKKKPSESPLIFVKHVMNEKKLTYFFLYFISSHFRPLKGPKQRCFYAKKWHHFMAQNGEFRV